MTDITTMQPRELIRGLMRGNRDELKLGYSPANAVSAVQRIREGLDATRAEDELRGYSEGFSDGMRRIESMVTHNDPDNIENMAYRDGYHDGQEEPVALSYPSSQAI